MEKYFVYLETKNLEWLKFGYVETPKIPEKKETISFHLQYQEFKNQIKTYEGNSLLKEAQIKDLFNKFNSKNYEVKKVHHNIEPNKKDKTLETIVNVVAKEKE